MFSFLQSTPPIDEPSAEWIFGVFRWALNNFDADVFKDETFLVTPTNKHFPGQASSPDEMARLIFERVQNYAGMQRWPFQLLPPGSCLLDDNTKLEFSGAVRGENTAISAASGPIGIMYDPSQVNAPEVMIAYFSYEMSRQLASTAKELPPEAEDNGPHIIELMAVFMGFGLMYANTALNFPQGGCRSCGPSTTRPAALSQYDITYALALFTVLKGIPDKEVLSHLKKSLRSHFKRCIKDVRGRDGWLGQMPI